jgi:hypothetical protein
MSVVVTRFLIVSSSKLAEHLQRQPLVDRAQLVVDEPVFDGGGGAGGDAAEEPRLVVAVRPRVAPPSQPDDRHGALRLEDRAEHLEPERVEHLRVASRLAEDHLVAGERAQGDLRRSAGG